MYISTRETFELIFSLSHRQPLLKRFKRHILSFVPTAKIESVRFRSIAFQKPTTKLPSEIDPSASSSEPPKRPAKDKEPLRQHEIDRVSAWQSSKDTPTGDPEKKYLTPQEKKRVAFIKHDFHENGDSVNAYVVFAHPPPKGMAERPEAVDIMDPYEAAKVAVVMCDGTPFEGKTLRVDGARKSRTGDAGREVMGDPKLSIFVGNLDFASKEEDLRAFFETLVANERGSQPQAQSLGGGDETKSSGWVTRVRIVRDKDTQLGKGFAYVQFVVRYLHLPLLPAIRRTDARVLDPRIVNAWMRYSPSNKEISSSRNGSCGCNGAKLPPHPRHQQGGKPKKRQQQHQPLRITVKR